MGQLDQRQSQEQLEIERNALTDWELRYARAKLDLKEKHYKVNIDVFIVMPYLIR